MPFIPTAETWRVAMTYQSLGGNNAANVIYFKDETGTLSSARATELADIVKGWAVTEWANIASDQWTMQRVDVTSAESQTGNSGSNNSPTAGAVAFDPLPSQDTVAVSLRTGAMGRSNRGRLYHVGLTEGDIADGLLTSTIQTALINGYLELLAAGIADDFTWSVVSFFTGGAPRAAGVPRTINQILIVDPKVDRQLRRKK